MLAGWKLTQEEIEFFAGLKMELNQLLEEAPEQLTAPAPQIAALAESAEIAIDSNQSRDFYHGLASGLKLWCNYAKQNNAPPQDTKAICHALVRCCSLYLDTPQS